MINHNIQANNTQDNATAVADVRAVADATTVANKQPTPVNSFGFLSPDEAASLLLENVKDYAMFLLDLSGHNVSWNPGVERILGYSEAQFVGQHTSAIFTPEDIEQGAPEQEMNTARAQHSAVDERWHVHKDGSRFWASGFLTFLQDEAGQPRGYAKIMRDRTDWKLLEQERERLLEENRKAREEAEENNRFKDHFISVVSHEMRTPLTSICGWLSLLRSGALQEPAISTGLDTVQRGADSLVRLVNDLLDSERIRTGKMQLEIEPVNLLSVMANAIEAVRYRAEEKSISITTKTISADHVVLGDAARLEQVLLNLLTNAVKFTPQGGSVEVCVNSHATEQGQGQCREQGQEVELTVSDTGKGIAPEFLPHVFDQFRQEEESHSRSYGGLGLGLYIVRELVELHGGTIQAESEGAGKGATFRVRLPAAPP